MKKIIKKIGSNIRLLFFSQIDKYFYKELIPNYVFGLMFFTVLIMLNQLFVLVKYYFEQNVSFGNVMLMLVTQLPFVMSYSIPFAILPAYLLTMGRFSQDSEITAMRSCGISPWRIILPGIMFGLLISVGGIAFKDKVEMPANLLHIRIRAKIIASRPAVELKNSSFINIGGYKLSFEKMETVDDIEILYNIHIVDIRGRKTIEAEMGRIFSDPENAEHYILKFKNGSISELSKQIDETTGEESEHFFISSFKYLSINSFVDLPEDYYSKSNPHIMTIKDIKTYISNKSKSILINITKETTNLNKIKDNIKKEKKQFQLNSKKWTKDKQIAQNTAMKKRVADINKKKKASKEKIKNLQNNLPQNFMMMLHKKYSLPLSSFVFVIISLSLGMYTARSGRSEGLGISVLVMMAYFGMMVGIENLINKRTLPPIGHWIPNIVFFIVGSVLLYKKMNNK